MCGINGFSFCNKELISAMTEKTKHRGPDDSGIFLDNNISLGHNRLSIIDLSRAGHQPMISKDGNLVIIFNGEIYNFLEIKKELINLGHKFYSKSDTEVILLGWKEWGSDVLKKINGIFSFAVWDNKKQDLFLVRDRFGVKPLYYCIKDNNIIFSSEIKSILLHDIDKKINQKALNIFFRFLYIPSPETAFEGIFKLEPGNFIKWNNGDIKIYNYHKFDYRVKYKNYDDARQNLKQKFDEVVSRQMVSDKPVGLFLSGGFDSTAVLGAMSKVVNHPIETFSARFDTDIDDNKYNADANLAKLTADIYRTNHNELVISTEDIKNNFFAVTYQMDDLASNHIQVANYLLAKAAKTKVDVVLGGDGGDELFAGYERYYLNYWIDMWQKIPSGLRKNNLTMTLASLIGKKEILNRVNISDHQDRFFDFMSQDKNDVEGILSKEVYNDDAVNNYFAKFFNKNSDFVRELMLTDLKTWLPDESLLRSDKMGMAHGLEQRVPILDEILVDFAFSIPDKWKINNRSQGKKILIEALSDYFPDYLFDQPKRGWFSPAAKWLRGDLHDFMKEILSPGFNAKTNHLFDYKYIDKIIDDHLSGRRYNLNLIWALMTFQVWYHEYFK